MGFCKKKKWNEIWHVIYGWKDIPLGNKIWYSTQWFVLWKYENLAKSLFFWQSSVKNIKVAKTEITVGESDVGQPIHIYVQHTYYVSGAFKLRLSIYSFYISCQLSSSEMTGMGMWAIIERIRMAYKCNTYWWVKTWENGLVLKINLYVKLPEC